MLSRIAPVLASCWLLVAPCLAQERPADAARRPNVLFIFTDDHAAHAISAYGSRINRTPNIDRIAREGMRFDNCFCTNSICAPSRAVILTGKHSHLNGQITNGQRFDGSQQTFPKLLRRAGYQTAMIGKWHLRSDPTGFDFWQVLYGQGPYYNPRMKTPDGPVKLTGYTTDLITDVAIEWLEQGRDESKPFLLMCQHKAPHRRWEPGPEHLTRYDGVDIPEPDDLFDRWTDRNSGAAEQEMTIARHMSERDLKLVPPPNLTPEQRALWDAAYVPKNRAFREADLSGEELVRWKYQRYIKDYLRCVASVDDNIGRLLAYLEESGLADDTVVIYTSDQGFYLGDHGWYDKRWMYEESLRMPLLVRWPGVTPPGSVCEALVQNLDFAETFLDIAGAEIPADMQGRSLVPLLRGETPDDWRESIYYHYYEYPAVHMVPRHYGVRTDRYKLIHYYTLDEWELFDLAEDPGEMRSVYGDPEYADVVRRLEAELQRLRELYRVPEDTRPVRRRGRGREKGAGTRAGRGKGTAAATSSRAEIEAVATTGTRRNASVFFFSREGGFRAHGQLELTYGAPEWKSEYARMLEGAAPGTRFRLGRDFWTTFDTNVTLRAGDTQIAPGTYYLCLEMSARDELSLVFLDAEKARESKLHPGQSPATEGGTTVVLDWREKEELQKTLRISFDTDPKTPAEVGLAIRWGGHELGADLTAELD